MKSFPMCSFLVVAAMSYTTIADISAEAYERLLLFPQQIAISELICTGLVISTNDDRSINVSLDEVLWGNTTSTNLIVSCLDEYDRFDLEFNKKYLVFAFTNNWWTANRSKEEVSCDMFSSQLPPTNRPVNLVQFANPRVMSPDYSVISFDRINAGGTNYWPAIRTFTTNYLEATRVQRNATMADLAINSFLGQNGVRSLPNEFRQGVLLFKITKGYFDIPAE